MSTRTLTKTKTRILGMVIVGVGVIGLGAMAAFIIYGGGLPNLFPAKTKTASMSCKTDVDCNNFACKGRGPNGYALVGRCEPYQDICSCQEPCQYDEDCGIPCATGYVKCTGGLRADQIQICGCSGDEPETPPDQSGQYVACVKDSDCANKLASCDKTKFNEVCGANNLCQCFAKSAPTPAPTPSPAPPTPAPTPPAPTPPAPTSQIQCEDSDGGLDSGKPGCIKYSLNGEVAFSCDYCDSNISMIEFGCASLYKASSSRMGCGNYKTCETTKISAFGQLRTAGYCE